jgi:hypothetical protein
MSRVKELEQVLKRTEIALTSMEATMRQAIADNGYDVAAEEVIHAAAVARTAIERVLVK